MSIRVKWKPRVICFTRQKTPCGAASAAGALADPWNILGFQGQFPLFTTREDSVPDQRMRFSLGWSKGSSKATPTCWKKRPRALKVVAEEVDARFARFADEWDRYGSTTIKTCRKLPPGPWELARWVARALGNGALPVKPPVRFPSGVNMCRSSRRLARTQVVVALLDRNDLVASLGLLMQWLSQADELSLTAGSQSFHRLLARWLDQLVAQAQSKDSTLDAWPLLRRLFDYLEANAGPLWQVPTLDEAAVGKPLPGEPPAGPAGEEDDDPERVLYEAAYEGVTFRDNADDLRRVQRYRR